MVEEPEAFAAAIPGPRLRPFVESLTGYRVEPYGTGVHRGLPSTALTFIVSIGDPIVLLEHPGGQGSGQFACVVGGLHDAPALIRADAVQEGVAIGLSPLGARALLAAPAAALWNTSVECADLVGPAGRELWERLQEPVGWAERFAVCERVLARILGPERELATELRHAWSLVVAGHTSMAEVAAEVGWSRQHLNRRFTAEFGTGPQTVARTARFERACVALRGGPSIAAAAADAGYYDQAHLVRDFRRFAGCTPSDWVREEVSSVQAAAPRAQADSAA